MSSNGEIRCDGFPGEQPTKEEILRFCQDSRGKVRTRTDYLLYPPTGRPLARIRFGSSATMESARAQQFAYERGARTPKIYHAFENSRGRAYILDEYIEGVPATDWIKDNKGQLSRLAAEVSKELEKMIHFEVPPDATPGAVGGGVCMHGFFDDVTGAWRLYDSIEHLEKDINKACH
ncbi:hypothetical protein NLJ89_g5054 [Agrocybe chaxingu]|uniref:Aminoglycoside phosphotransferase domain-containing protein n=1 Tax=Agrocybe chaxingu TaxID=84603 RepID=A0A9W8K7W7_9AGAR|nr:hypothetical protein NLJ89_g5054 [Agrocybe chaxingu]